MKNRKTQCNILSLPQMFFFLQKKWITHQGCDNAQFSLFPHIIKITLGLFNDYVYIMPKFLTMFLQQVFYQRKASSCSINTLCIIRYIFAIFLVFSRFFTRERGAKKSRFLTPTWGGGGKSRVKVSTNKTRLRRQRVICYEVIMIKYGDSFKRSFFGLHNTVRDKSVIFCEVF